jgi:hypothetical protein
VLLEKADTEKRSIERDGRRHYWKYKGPQDSSGIPPHVKPLG